MLNIGEKSTQLLAAKLAAYRVTTYTLKALLITTERSECPAAPRGELLTV